MSREHPSSPLPLPRFKRPSEAVVFWTLTNLCDGAGGLFQVSIKRLSRHCGLSVSTTNRAVLRLAEAGLVTYRRGVNQGRPSTFELAGRDSRDPSARSLRSVARDDGRVARNDTRARDGGEGRGNVSGPQTGGLKIGAASPNDNDHDLPGDTYLHDNDRGAVHKQDESGDPDRGKKLAAAIAQSLGDTANLALYVSYCRRFPERVIMRAFEGAREPSPEAIRVSRGALFNYLVQFYGGKRSYNSDSGHPARQARNGRGSA